MVILMIILVIKYSNPNTAIREGLSTRHFIQPENQLDNLDKNTESLIAKIKESTGGEDLDRNHHIANYFPEVINHLHLMQLENVLAMVPSSKNSNTKTLNKDKLDDILNIDKVIKAVHKTAASPIISDNFKDE
jgi:hypothetical protein